MDKIIGYSLAILTFGTSYLALSVALPIALIGKAGIDFTVEFLDAFDRSYNATPG